jgi:hypothetical protein
LAARHVERRGNIEPFDAAKQSIQLVAIQIADKVRRIQQRARPTRRSAIDDTQRIATFLGVGRDHDRNVMIG